MVNHLVDRVATPIRACLIINPRSGQGELDLTEAFNVLERQHWLITVRQKLHGGHATELAQEAAREGYDVVVDCGGDGTLSEIIEGLVGTDVAIGTLPGGTVNSWAREVGISQQLRVAALQLAGAERHRVDVGHLNINGKSHHHFLLMAGLGVDGAVMSHVSKPLKKRIGVLAVGVAALESLPSIRTIPVRARLDGIEWQGKIAQVIVGNTRRYAGFTQITSHAYIDDGLLDVCFITATNMLSAGRQVGSLLLRQQPSENSAEFYRVSSFTLHTTTPLPLQLDGGVVSLPVEPDADGITYEFSSIVHGVTVLVPRTYDGELFRPENSHIGVEPTIVSSDGESAHPATATTSAPQGRKGHLKKRNHQGKKLQKTVQVSGLEVDTISAVDLKNGHPLQILVGAESTLKNQSGKTGGYALLAQLAIGDIIEVKGNKVDAPHSILARKIALMTSAHA